MKRIANFFIPLFAALLLSYACQKESGHGKIKVLMTDAPADFTEVNVNITEVWAHYSGNENTNGGWIELDANPGFYDLLQLQNGVTEVIADPTTIPIGKITQLRLILGEDNYAVENVNSISVQHPLLLSSQDKNGLKVNLKSDIIPNETIVVTLDFDAGKSIVETGSGEYKLKPVLKVQDVTYLP